MPGQRPRQRLHLPQCTACVGVEGVQLPVRIARGRCGGGWVDDADVRETEDHGQMPLVLKGLGKMLVGLQEQDRDCAVEFRDHGEQQRGVCAE